MKVLIVDDERHVREAIRYFVPWAKYGITDIREAANGQEAIEEIRMQQPAIVFTDMRMPLLDGAELLEWLHEYSPHTKTIVISGYQDFNYVKPAIVYGGTDYLLKPLNSKQLIAAAEHAFQLWLAEEQEREQDRRRNMQLNILRPVYWDKVLSDLINGGASFAEIAPLLTAELGMPIGAESCRIAVISLQGAGCRLLQRFRGDLSLTSYVMANVCNEFLAPGSCGFAFRYWQGGADIVILFWDAVQQAEAQLERINEAVQLAYGVQVDIGLSGLNKFPQQLQQAFGQAGQALRERNVLQGTGRIHTCREEVPAASGSVQDYAIVESGLEKLRLAVLTGEQDRMNQVVEEWAERLSGLTVLTESSLQSMQGQLAAVLKRWRPEVAVALETCYDEEGLFSPAGWSEGLKALLQRLSRENRLSENADSKMVMEIRDYLDQHYDQEMTLQHIAERFFISRENVSRKFKQITGENLSDYLTGLRIDKAKLLLQNTPMRLSQISELVGYEDEKYFSRVFKKATGQTPREYRKLGEN
ncbi:response regulator transcription factor [Paenibacillus donghaensis]|uniref:DNA-binding response regulator n=1 Tax=Paenibacillus donghaensis TaxID=414771 RepID=A0A2Z2KLG7_9BACL|nr:response regulator [Paenibacillus donghaensis]ASA24233.1 hypothetical protein B9T62_27795 [Paenibacillus donghaensis]